MIPQFYPPDNGIDVVAEFRAFIDQTERAGAEVLAELGEMQLHGDISEADDTATTVTDLFCRRRGVWHVFYTAAKRIPFNLIILHVCKIAGPTDFASCEAEAARRLRRTVR